MDQNQAKKRDFHIYWKGEGYIVERKGGKSRKEGRVKKGYKKRKMKKGRQKRRMKQGVRKG